MSDKMIETLTNIGIAALIALLGLLAIKILLGITRKALKKSQLDESIHTFVVNTVKIILLVVLLIAILGYLNVPPAPFVTVLGACGAAVALALKDSLGNVAGGIIILVNKPFKKGDTVEVSGTVGKVHSIDLLTTQLRTFDNKVIIIPNGTITTSILTNYSTEGVRRVDCTFSIAYESDIAKAKEILAAIAETMEDVMNVPEPIIGIADYSDSAVILDMKVWCETAKYYDVEYEVKENVKLAFDEAGISIPYPQMDVHVKK